MAKRIAITGASGFVGKAIVHEAASRGFAVHAIVRSENEKLVGENVSTFKGDLFDAASLDRAMKDCDAVIHLVGIIAEQPSKGVTFQRMHVEGTRAAIEATKRAGIKRYIHMSANGTRPDAVSEYHKTKFAAEQLVKASGLDWTIFRPSMIHGPKGEFTKMETDWAKGKSVPWVAMPYFGAGLLGTGGAGKLQPVFVNDVARAFVDALVNEKTVNQTYAICGNETVTWPQMHKTFAAALADKPNRATIAIPAWYAKAIATIVPGGLLPFNKDQVQMSQEDNVADMTGFSTDFGWTPRGLGETVGLYANHP